MTTSLLSVVDLCSVSTPQTISVFSFLPLLAPPKQSSGAPISHKHPPYLVNSTNLLDTQTPSLQHLYSDKRASITRQAIITQLYVTVHSTLHSCMSDDTAATCDSTSCPAPKFCTTSQIFYESQLQRTIAPRAVALHEVVRIVHNSTQVAHHGTSTGLLVATPTGSGSVLPEHEPVRATMVLFTCAKSQL